MKITGTVYETMRAGMRAAVEHFGGPASVKAAHAGQTDARILWHLWALVDHNLRDDDAHPGFANGYWHRFYPQKPGFDLYADPAVCDTHILTALKKIGRELGLVT